MSTLPCLAIANGSPDAIRHSTTVQTALQAGLVELRLDRIDKLSLDDFAALARALGPDHIITTYRHPSEGGGRSIPEAERIAFLKRAMEIGVGYVDLEFAFSDALDELVREQVRCGSHTRFILSMHDFEKTPDKLSRIADAMADRGSDIAKIATFVNRQSDNLKLLQALKSSPIPLVAVGMGPAGLPSRILGAKFGMPFTFCASEEFGATASGQPTLDELLDVYHIGSIDSETEIYGVIGNPVSHSISPAMQNAAFRALGMNAVYLPFHVDEDPVAFVRDFRRFDGLNLRGLSITIPHKIAAIPAADGLDDLAKRIGAINTLVPRHDGTLLGVNTDCLAATDAIETAAGGAGSLRGKRAVVVGAGRAARAIAVGLADRGVKGWIANRTESKGRELAETVGFDFIPLSDIATIRPEVLANATSVGMTPNIDKSPVHPDALPGPGGVVFDAVYNPRMTRLLRESKERGAKTVDGLSMLVGQGAMQFKLWKHLDAPVEIMERVVAERLEKR